MSPLLLFPRSVKIKFAPLNTWQIFQHCCTRPKPVFRQKSSTVVWTGVLIKLGDSPGDYSCDLTNYFFQFFISISGLIVNCRVEVCKKSRICHPWSNFRFKNTQNRKLKWKIEKKIAKSQEYYPRKISEACKNPCSGRKFPKFPWLIWTNN